ncbi:28930_t:CDS:2, partial [Racocetra persica]
TENNHLCSYGFAKYKPSKETSQTIRWKYFFHADEKSRIFMAGDIMFISGKYIVENSEQSNRKPKETEGIIHFGMECTEYNSVTRPLGPNIKIGGTYLISGFFKFSQSGKLMIEATEIEYLKITQLNYNIPESSSSSVSNTRSIIDIIADDIDSITTEIPPKHAEFTTFSVKHNTTSIDTNTEINLHYGSNQNYADLDAQIEEKEKHNINENIADNIKIKVFKMWMK